MIKDNLAYEKAVTLYKNKNYVEAFPKLEYLADVEDNQNAQSLVASMYLTGNGTNKQIDKAVYYYKKSASQGNIASKYNLALMYETGKGVECDYYKALVIYKEIVTKHPKVQERLKNLYEEFKTLIANNDSNGYLYTGFLLSLGIVLKQNYEQAIQYFRKAASKDNARAYRALAVMYYHAEGVEQSYEKALSFYNKAASLKDAPSLYAIGLMYINEQGVQKNVEMALRYLKHAAVQNYAPACYAIGLLFSNSEKNQEIAITNLNNAAKQNHAPACYALARIYQNRLADKQKAIEYYKQAGNLGHLKSQQFLAKLYDEGVYVEASLETSYSWHLKAANNGDESAKEIIKEERFNKN